MTQVFHHQHEKYFYRSRTLLKIIKSDAFVLILLISMKYNLGVTIFFCPGYKLPIRFIMAKECNYICKSNWKVEKKN